MSDLFSVRADLHPPCIDQDLADAKTDMRCSFAELYELFIRGFPADLRGQAAYLRRITTVARDVITYGGLAAFVADRLADQELAGLLDETQEG